MSTISAGTTSNTALVSTGNTNGNLVFQTNGTTTALTLATDQLATFAGRASFPSTIGVGGATAAASGSGISFPATQSASTNANTLDDYEEGTWTPVLRFGGGSTGMTYSSQTGYYVKTGKSITVGFVITLTAKGSSTGAATVEGFTGFTPQSEGRGGGVGANSTGMSLTTVGIGFYFSSAATFELQKLTTAGSGTVSATNSDFTDSSSFRVTLSFICDS